MPSGDLTRNEVASLCVLGRRRTWNFEYCEFLLGLKGPKYSALSRIKDVLDNTRIARDMRSFQGRSLDKDEFAFQCKIVLGLNLLAN